MILESDTILIIICGICNFNVEPGLIIRYANKVKARREFQLCVMKQLMNLNAMKI